MYVSLSSSDSSSATTLTWVADEGPNIDQLFLHLGSNLTVLMNMGELRQMAHAITEAMEERAWSLSKPTENAQQ